MYWPSIRFLRVPLCLGALVVYAKQVLFPYLHQNAVTHRRPASPHHDRCWQALFSF